MLKEAFASVSEAKSRGGNILLIKVIFDPIPETVIQFETWASVKRPSDEFNTFVPLCHALCLKLTCPGLVVSRYEKLSVWEVLL